VLAGRNSPRLGFASLGHNGAPGPDLFNRNDEVYTNASPVECMRECSL